MVGCDRGGFTLVEAIIALTLSSVLVVLVSTVFLVQNQYFAIQLERSAAQDNARMTTEMVASEIRSVMKAGVTRANNTRLRVNSPMAMGVVCGHPGSNRVAVQIDGGTSGLVTDDVEGVALLDPATGDWDYHDAGWSNMYQSGGTPAAACFTNGADTVGAYNDFIQFRRFNNYFGGLPAVGSVVMFYREVEYEFDTSEMDPSVLALFRSVNGDDPVELVTGINGTAQFQYRRVGQTSYQTTVGSGDLDEIDAIRIEAQARSRPRTGGVDDVTFGWGVNVYLRNGG